MKEAGSFLIIADELKKISEAQKQLEQKHEKHLKYNQNCMVEKENNLYKISFPTLEKRVGVPVVAETYQKHWLDKLLNGEAKQGTMHLYEKRGRWFASITISFETEEPQGEPIEPKIMGIKWVTGG